MSEFRKFFRQIFQDANGDYSSKRTAVAITMVMFVAAFVADLGWKMTITEFIFNGVLMVILGGLGLTLGEGPVNAFMNKISGGNTNLQASGTSGPPAASE